MDDDKIQVRKENKQCLKKVYTNMKRDSPYW